MIAITRKKSLTKDLIAFFILLVVGISLVLPSDMLNAKTLSACFSNGCGFSSIMCYCVSPSGLCGGCTSFYGGCYVVYGGEAYFYYC
jgi:hypothetical protein